MSACAICLTTEVSVGGKNSCVTECGHIFCLTCILRASQENTACPLCRNVLVPPKNTAEETERAYENGRVDGYDMRHDELEEEYAEVQHELEEEHAEEIDKLTSEILRCEDLLRFERINAGKPPLTDTMWSQRVVGQAWPPPPAAVTICVRASAARSSSDESDDSDDSDDSD